MIASLVALLVLSPVQEQAPRPTAGAVISKMLARYSGLNSLTGGIRLTVSAMGESTSVDTTLAYEKPSLVYLKQVLNTKEPKMWLVVSDGKHFSYPKPPNLPGETDRLMEAVNQKGVIQTCQDIYSAGATSLRDREAPLDIAFGRRPDLQVRRAQWATFGMLGREQVRGIDAYVVGGDWREYRAAPVSATYKMWISEAGDLLRYQESGLVAIPVQSRGNAPTAQVVSTWEVNLKPNAETDHKLYVMP